MTKKVFVNNYIKGEIPGYTGLTMQFPVPHALSSFSWRDRRADSFRVTVWVRKDVFGLDDLTREGMIRTAVKRYTRNLQRSIERYGVNDGPGRAHPFGEEIPIKKLIVVTSLDDIEKHMFLDYSAVSR
jgi:hypothetical protein